MLIITLEGGLVSSVSTDDPELKAKLGEVVVIDYDTEGVDEDETHLIKTQAASGRPEEFSVATVVSLEVEDTEIDVEFLENRL